MRTLLSSSSTTTPRSTTAFSFVLLAFLLASSCAVVLPTEALGTEAAQAAASPIPRRGRLLRRARQLQQLPAQEDEQRPRRQLHHHHWQPTPSPSQSSQPTTPSPLQPSSRPPTNTRAPTSAPSPIHPPVNSTSTLRWASTGGGWRAMAADMGFANLFAQAGIFTPTSSTLSGMSSTSGATWFSTQFFYSPSFYKAVQQSSPAELYTFVQQWMQAYQTFQQNVPSDPWCTQYSELLNATSDFFDLYLGTNDIDMEEWCNLYLSNGDGDAAMYVSNMLTAVSTAYGDSTFASTTFTPENRVPALQHTNLLAQMSLAPNAKCDTSMAYLSPNDASSSSNLQVYTVPLPAVQAVTSTSSQFVVAAPPNELPLMVSVGTAPILYMSDDWSSFTLYPGAPAGSSSSLTTSTLAGGMNVVSSTQEFATPFGGQPTVLQVASASSDAIGALAGSVPSLMAQFISKAEDVLGSDYVNMTLLAFAELSYMDSYLGNLAVDAQWQPNFAGCSNTDGRLVDGGYTDNPSLALNVGQYQSEDGADLTETLKVLLTDTNNFGDSNVEFLSYFATDFNAGVAPGSYIWPPSSTLPGASTSYNLTSYATPIRSAQIFSTPLNEADIARATIAVPGTNLTYAHISAVTTNNAAFGVSAGQPVEILYFRINSFIPTIIAGTQMTSDYTNPLAELAQSVASSSQLLAAVTSFLES